MSCYLGLFSFVALYGLSQSVLVDMSYDFDNNTVYPAPGLFPTFDWNYNILPLTDETTVKWGEFAAAEHGGTHIDVPSHFLLGKSVHQLDINAFFAPVVVIDIKDRAEVDPDANMMISDIDKYESLYGKIPEKAVIMQNSGWQKHWPNTTAFLGARNGNFSDLHYPYLSTEAVEWLVEKRNPVAFGVDTSSFDQGTNPNNPSHKALLGAGLYGIEMVANLDLIPPAGAKVYVFPMKIKEGTGAPTRVIAEWDIDHVDGNGGKNNYLSYLLIPVVVVISVM